MASAVEKELLLKVTASLVVKLVEKGMLQPIDVPAAIGTTYAAFAAGALSATRTSAGKLPAVAIDQSVTDDFIICLEDGKKFKSMRGHLRKLKITPNEYREKWGLPKDYPIVARNYSNIRSRMAIASSLGRRHKVENID